MITRREVLKMPAVVIAARQSALPSGACDCHIHVIGDSAKFPFVPERVYTPEPATASASAAFHRSLGTTRTVVVTPSVYGSNNACTLDALATLGASARGVAVIDDKTTAAAMQDMERAGIRGIRINLETAGQTDPAIGRARLQAAIDRLRGSRWHIQLFTRPSVIAGIADLVEAAPMPIVFDHFGGAQAAAGMNQPGFDALLRVVKSGRAYVKISGAYRVSTQAPDYPDVRPMAEALIAANPDRILWGTDWPHVDSAVVPGRSATTVVPHLKIDDAGLLRQLFVWTPDAATRRKILVDNPARLYGF